MCHPPIGKPLASVLEHGYVARDCSGNPEMRMWPVWATELSVTFHHAMESNTNNAFPPQPTPISHCLSFTSWSGFLMKKFMHLWQQPCHPPLPLKPISKYQSSVFPFFSSAFWLFTSHATADREGETMTWARLNSWEQAKIAVGHGHFRPKSCHSGNLSASRLLLQARTQDVFQDLRTIQFWKPLQIPFVLEELSIPTCHNQ